MLAAGHTLTAMHCYTCTVMHLDKDAYAIHKHVVQLCKQCNARFKIAPAVQGNPFAALGCSMVEGKLAFSRLPNA